MKKIAFLLSFLTVVGLFSCDKVDNPYPSIPSTELDYTLFPGGGEAEYLATEWPIFSTNSNTNRNILIEDFTGHRCIFCPPAGALARSLEDANPGRVYAAAIHTGPDAYDENWGGVAPGDFQTIVPPIYLHNFANNEALQIGAHFGTMVGSAFIGNPRGTVSRILDGSNQHTLGPNDWTAATNAAVSANDLKVNIQSATNYYPSTSGLFLHTEIDVIDQSLLTNTSLYTVVYLLEDSIVKPQAFPGGIDSLNYVHHDVLRGCIDGRAFGQKLDDDHKDANGLYYFNYSFKLPAQYASDNMHLLIYVRDETTEEVYHVIKQEIL